MPLLSPEEFAQAKNLGLLGAGLGMLSSNYGNYGKFGPGFGQGGLLGLQAYQGAVGNLEQQKMREMQMQSMLAQQQEAERKRQALSQYISGLPPEQQAAAALSPETFIKEQFAGYNLKPGEGRYVGGQAVTQRPEPRRLVDVPVPGQAGVTQPTWLGPGETTGTTVGGPKMPSILNPDVFAAEVAKARASRPEVNVRVPINLAQNKYAEVVGGEAAKRDFSQQESAISASDNVEKLNRVIAHLKSSDALTGMGADWILQLRRAQQLIMRDKKSASEISDTELLNALLGSDVFPMIKELGIGARGLDTPAEREFLRQVMSGTVTMNQQTLIRLAETRKNIAERTLKRWNERVGSGELDEFFRLSGSMKQKIQMPMAPRSPTGAETGLPPGVTVRRLP